ncbi:MAG: Heparinase family protein [Rhodospirillales bacterium]|nr:Heparinase family protein [Rhodospirillales bacterium]
MVAVSQAAQRAALGAELIRQRLALLRRLPPGVIARRAAGIVGRGTRAAVGRYRDRHRATYCDDPQLGPLVALLDVLPIASVRGAAEWIAPAAELYRRHYFDILGSGWCEVRYGMECPGVEGTRYPAAPAVTADRDGRWLVGRINAANLATSQSIWRLTDRDYQPIDWQLDKSGYRWRSETWAADAPIGHLAGVDVKVPWELARMQHLAVLAWAYGLARGGHPGMQPAPVYLTAFRNQILDFIACNPPRFGVNWRCTMDVAIRAANWVVAANIFRAFGGGFDQGFASVLTASLVDHGRHVVSHLEIFPEGRGNHYLADITGLLFIAAALPRSRESDAWLAFAMQELLAETQAQFGEDGGNFEASTSYHRLSAEMVAFGTALLLGLPEQKRAALREADPQALRTSPRRPLSAERAMPGADHLASLAAMAAFTRAVTKPGGRIAQIGDNDSGRFFKLHPLFVSRTVAEARQRYANLENYRGLPDGAAFLDEDDLDHGATLAAIGELVEPRPPRKLGFLDAVIVRALVAKHGVGTVAAVPPAWRNPPPPPDLPGPIRTTEIVAPDGDLRHGLRHAAFPDFGLWIYRSDRLFLAIRCGSIGHHGRGAHAHNDQLTIELAIDGEDWIADPGSYLYTPSRPLRNAYRSVAAHCAPRLGEREPGRLDLGDFWLGDEAKARCLFFDDTAFVGEHCGYGRIVRRRIEIGETAITIRDFGLPDAADLRFVGRDEVAAKFGAAVPFSPGYGKRLRTLGPPPR